MSMNGSKKLNLILIMYKPILINIITKYISERNKNPKNTRQVQHMKTR